MITQSGIETTLEAARCVIPDEELAEDYETAIAALLDVAEAVRMADLDFIIDGLMETSETMSAVQLSRIRDALGKIPQKSEAT